MENLLKTLLPFLGMVVISLVCNAQSQCGRTALLGYHGAVVVFNDTAYPKIRTTFPSLTDSIKFSAANSSISDDITGRPLLYSNSVNIYDTLGNIISNGNLLTDSIWRTLYPGGVVAQQSIFLPIGGKKYVFLINNITDSMYQHCWIANQCGLLQQNFDELRYNLIDMNLNNGAGAVVIKNKKLLSKTSMKMANMHACKHANGKDWWVLRPGIDSLTMYRFLITSDSVYGPFTQTWNSAQSFGINKWGQMSFSPDGTKYISILERNYNKMVIGDFDRCTGLLSNWKMFRVPYDIAYPMDSAAFGICYSPNNQFAYISRELTIFQLDLNEPDSSLAWYIVKSGSDSLVPPNNLGYGRYGTLFNGIDNRIYVGHYMGNTGYSFSSINHPDIKGIGCDWCNLCLRCPAPLTSHFLSGFANQPNYALGPTNNPNCWPVGVPATPLIPDDEWLLYPNPVKEEVTVHIKCKENGWFKMYNMLGELVFEASLSKGEVDHHLLIPYSLPNGLYSFQCRYKQGELKMGKITLMR